MENEIIKQLLGVSIHVKTNTGAERTIRYFDLKDEEGSYVHIIHDDTIKPRRKIRIELCCDGYSMEVI